MKIIALASALLLGASVFGMAEAQTRRPATINYGYVFGEYDYYDAKGGSLNGGGYRAGVGAEYWFAPQWSLRAGFHRQNALGVADDMSVGIGYRF